jgi:hypothetical protein
MLLHRKGKFTIAKSKSSRLSYMYSEVVSLPLEYFSKISRYEADLSGSVVFFIFYFIGIYEVDLLVIIVIMDIIGRHQYRRFVSQQLWHDKDPSLLIAQSNFFCTVQCGRGLKLAHAHRFLLFTVLRPAEELFTYIRHHYRRCGTTKISLFKGHERRT